ncbi:MULTISPECIES: hypothetical protein [unclassified Caballeronia]|uniref:hypothetical protein n=1 Tax=unclassified Caballeronia TaxID=2646786 RepID=UPI0028572F64|nr:MULTISPECIES: hypothetical protein [unclassified Caballeronia]MDR5770193.1 hypothetical protein [Caballeronia sp. LZ002]MDR5803450.1 hypothetical protein [Caballeronia sp. LZ001]MDR5845630.1 hypothetical protein [Caballeronia sp. LZ003]
MDTPDYRYWMALDRWNRSEAAMLLDNKDPDKHRGAKLSSPDADHIYPDARKIYRMLERFSWASYGGNEYKTKERPLYIIDAARRMGIAVPEPLLQEAKRRQERDQPIAEQPDSVSRPASSQTKERATMLKLILALACGGYGMKVDATRNLQAKSMRTDCERLGIPLDDETIKKYLDEAKALRRAILAEQGPYNAPAASRGSS